MRALESVIESATMCRLRLSPVARSVRYLLAPMILLLGLMLAASPVATAQPGNLEQIEECARAISDSLLGGHGDNTPLCIEVARHPAAWVMEEALVRSAESRGIRIAACDSLPRSAGERITLAITAIGMEYREIDADDSLARDARIEASAIVQRGTGTSMGASAERSVATYVAVRRDTVDADQMSHIEASGYDFAKGNVPQRGSSGVWKKLVEPAVVLGASVVMVILLFTVRSQ